MTATCHHLINELRGTHTMNNDYTSTYDHGYDDDAVTEQHTHGTRRRDEDGTSYWCDRCESWIYPNTWLCPHLTRDGKRDHRCEFTMDDPGPNEGCAEFDTNPGTIECNNQATMRATFAPVYDEEPTVDVCAFHAHAMSADPDLRSLIDLKVQ